VLGSEAGACQAGRGAWHRTSGDAAEVQVEHQGGLVSLTDAYRRRYSTV